MFARLCDLFCFSPLYATKCKASGGTGHSLQICTAEQQNRSHSTCVIPIAYTYTSKVAIRDYKARLANLYPAIRQEVKR